MKIGLEFGGRDHSTVMSSYEKMVNLLKENDVMMQAVIRIEHQLGLS